MSHRPELAAEETKYSELGQPPEPCRPLAPLCFVFVLSVVLILNTLLVLLSPFILLGMLVRTLKFCGVKYLKSPQEQRVAVIGGGWAGVQIASSLTELGVTPTCFEQADSLGGTWHPSLRYHGLQLHSPLWTNTFAEHGRSVPYSQDQDLNDGKMMGTKMNSRISEFARKKELPYQCNSTVKKVKMQSSDMTAMLVVEDTKTGEQREEGPFDFVSFTGFAGKGEPPKLKGAEQFQGKQFHPTSFKEEDYDDIVKNNKKVIVVGGSKSACDMMLNFERGGHTNSLWVYRKPYLFWKYEVMGHDRSCFGKLRGFAIFMGFLLAFFPILEGLYFWAIGISCTHDEDGMHNDVSKFHLGVLCARQRRDLAKIPRERRRTGTEPVEFTSSGVKLKSGEVVEADVVIWAIGNTTGIEKISFEKDGRPFEVTRDMRLLDHYIMPRFPVFGQATCMFTCFGPMRGTNAAEYTVYHLCCREPLTEDYMEKSASKNWATLPPTEGLAWSRTSINDPILKGHIDWVTAGLEPFPNFLKHMIELFVFGHMEPIHWNLLPKSAPPTSRAAEMGNPLLKS